MLMEKGASITIVILFLAVFVVVFNTNNQLSPTGMQIGVGEPNICPSDEFGGIDSLCQGLQEDEILNEADRWTSKDCNIACELKRKERDKKLADALMACQQSNGCNVKEIIVVSTPCERSYCILFKENEMCVYHEFSEDGDGFALEPRGEPDCSESEHSGRPVWLCAWYDEQSFSLTCEPITSKSP